MSLTRQSRIVANRSTELGRKGETLPVEEIAKIWIEKNPEHFRHPDKVRHKLGDDARKFDRRRYNRAVRQLGKQLAHLTAD